MNAPITPLATCPLCRTAIDYWPKNHPVKECNRCMRPLALVPTLSRHIRAYKIVSVYAAAKNLTAVIALIALLSLSIRIAQLQTLALIVVSAFLVRGAIEAADGLAGLRSGVDFSWGMIRSDTTAKRYSVAKIAAGIFLLILGIVGIGAR